MNEENKPKSIEKRLDELERWQKYNIEKIREDFLEFKTDYMEAPGVFNPNFNQERYLDMPTNDYIESDYKTQFHHRLDMGGDKFNRKILEQDFIDELVRDTMVVEQTPENTKLESEKKVISSLRDMARFIKACEKYIKNNPNTVQAFLDGLGWLRRQYEEAISHLGQIRKIPAGDFLTSEVRRRWSLRNFKKSIEKTTDLAYDLLHDFEDITSDFIDF